MLPGNQVDAKAGKMHCMNPFFLINLANMVIVEKYFQASSYSITVLIMHLFLHGCGGCGRIQLAGDAEVDDNGIEIPSTSTWAKTYGDTGEDCALSVVESSEGGFVIAGWTAFRVLGIDYWLLKLDADGNVVWEKAYGGEKNDWALSIRRTSNGDYIVVGWTTSYGAGAVDTWVLKLDEAGDIIWQKAYGNMGWNAAFTIEETSDHGYVVAGETMEPDGVNYSMWVLKLDPEGYIEWEKVYGSIENEAGFSIQQTMDGGYIVAKWSSGYTVGDEDFWLLKLDAAGNALWQKAYGGSEYDYVYAARQTIDGGYIAAGGTESFGMGLSDFWILKLDVNGNIMWQKAYGGEGDDAAYSISQTQDGGFVASGWTDSFSAGGTDFLIIKLDRDGNPVWQKTYGAADIEYENRVRQTSDGGYILAGGTHSFGAGDSDVWVLRLNEVGDISETCPEGIGTNSFATVTDTNVTAEEIPVSHADYHTDITFTNAEAFITSAVIETQCSR